MEEREKRRRNSDQGIGGRTREKCEKIVERNRNEGDRRIEER